MHFLLWIIVNYIEIIYTVFFFLISLRNLLYNSPKLTNTYKQTSTVIYNRLSVITDEHKSASSSSFESCIPLVNSPCFHTSVHFMGGSPFYAIAPCLTSFPWSVRESICLRFFTQTSLTHTTFLIRWSPFFILLKVFV